MSEHIKEQVIDQVKSNSPFIVQLDESTDVFCTLLTAFVRYICDGEFKDEFLCIINLPSITRGEDIYQTIDTFWRKMISNGNRCAHFVQMSLRPC